MSKKFQQLIEESQRILITSHTSPDPDAVSSALLLGNTLRLNFPDKQIEMILEEEPEGLDFLDGYDQIKFQPILKALSQTTPDLFVMVDVANYARVSRKEGEQIGEYISHQAVKTAAIDHHEPNGRDEVDVYINTSAPAAVQEVYKLCFEQLSLKQPDNYARTTMLGLYADTGGFIYITPDNAQTFDLVKELVVAGANMEVIKNQLNQFSESQMKVVSELAGNTTHTNDFTYSFMSDEFVEQWLATNHSAPSLHRATKTYIDNYIRSVDGRKWGFITYKDTLEDDNIYSVSFRSLRFTKDVEKLAASLDGGGHKSAAGAKVQASNIQEAIEKIKGIIAESD